MQANHTIFVLYVPGANLDVLLNALDKTFVDNLIWGVEAIEVIGDEAQAFAQQVESAPNYRLLVDGQELRTQTSKFLQAIEGTFAGYYSEKDAETFLQGGAATLAFTSSPVVLAFRAVDGSGFDIYLRSKTIAAQIIALYPAAQWQDIGDYILG